jgi:hypothetical protein
MFVVEELSFLVVDKSIFVVEESTTFVFVELIISIVLSSFSLLKKANIVSMLIIISNIFFLISFLLYLSNLK